MLHKAWSSIEEVPYCFLGSSIKFQGHTGWKIDDLNPIWVRLLCRSQLSNPSDLPCLCLFPTNRCQWSIKSCSAQPRICKCVLKKFWPEAPLCQMQWANNGLMLINSCPLDKIAAVSQRIFPYAISWMKSFLFWIRFHWSLFLRVQLTTQH